MGATEPAASHERITAGPAILGGKPAVRGTRLAVELVLDRLAAEPDVGALLRNYPHLTLDDVRACLAFARDALAAAPRGAGAPPRSGQPSQPAPAR
jgi:uncharacterized protein (DUF433 family)